jgi:iron(III) transport system ATP-binding protein
VALARSIVYRPQLLLLDEPLSNLDAKLRLRLRDDLRVILKRTGMTALYVTHDQAEAVVLGDRIGVMRDGRLLQIGTPDEIYNRPADLFVANFTGATNELAGVLVARDGTYGVIDFGEGRRAEAYLLQTLAPGDKVRVALRPENIAIGRRDDANSFTAKVTARRYQGAQTVYDIDLFGRRLEALELGTAARHPIGVEAAITLPREACWAYRDTGPSSYD